jgi:hypothetical protein
MTHGHPKATPDDVRRREEIWRAAVSDVAATAAARYVELATVLGLPADVARPFVSACLEAARQYQTGCMYANYERRTGHPYPDEGREHEDESRAKAWEAEVAALRSAATAL